MGFRENSGKAGSSMDSREILAYDTRAGIRFASSLSEPPIYGNLISIAAIDIFEQKIHELVFLEKFGSFFVNEPL
jgi:hypothetical protein